MLAWWDGLLHCGQSALEPPQCSQGVQGATCFRGRESGALLTTHQPRDPTRRGLTCWDSSDFAIASNSACDPADQSFDARQYHEMRRDCDEPSQLSSVSVAWSRNSPKSLAKSESLSRCTRPRFRRIWLRRIFLHRHHRPPLAAAA
jgi:hypothetical protein